MGNWPLPRGAKGRRAHSRTLSTIALLGLWSLALGALAGEPTPPKAFFGFAIGDDYQLNNYTATAQYLKKLAAESDRLRLVEIGRTEEGRPQYMVIASSPANLARLEHYRRISEKLARAQIPEAEARDLAKDGKAVVWIDGGLHATETVGAQQLIETIWQVASRNDAEMRRFLDDTIVLLVHANPDGHELVGDWYMREPVPEKRMLDQIPVLYNKYAGHDNNRDAFMNALQETTNMSRVLYLEWFPQIMYNHHQSAPTGTVIAIPPYRNPANYNIHPSVLVGIEGIAAAMNQRYLAEHKPGAVSRNGTFYSAWWNGGQRTAPYFHNMIGLLTEITGNPTPSRIGFVPDRQIPSTDLPLPIEPQPWHFRQSIDYSLSANWAVLDYASRHREELLLGIYRMGRDAIAKGSTDSWTYSPTRLEALKREVASATDPAGGDASWNRYMAGPLPDAQWRQLRRPEDRDPRAYVIPSGQRDFNTALEFVNALLKSGIAVERADADFGLAGKHYGKGSYIVRTDQAFRPHVLDMFEPQDHPHDFEYAGGPPIAPYDSAGWTLAMQTGVSFDRVLDGPVPHFTQVPHGQLQSPAAGSVHAVAGGTAACYLIAPGSNDAFKLVNALLARGIKVARTPVASARAEAGSFVVAAGDGVAAALAGLAAKTGIDAQAASDCPAAGALRAPRIALVDRYGGSMPSGWNRLILERFGFGYEVVYPAQIDAGDLHARYDVVVLPADIRIPPASGQDAGAPAEPALQPKIDPARVPERYRDRLGAMSEKSIASLRRFLEQGGTVIAEGMATQLAYHLDIGVSDHLVKREGGRQARLSNNEYYIPGSLLSAAVNRDSEATRGMDENVDLYFADTRFSRSPVFDLAPGAPARPLLRFASAAPLRSGWAWGQAYLRDGVIGLEAPVGNGRIYLYGTDITFRSQMHGGYKLLFNPIYASVAGKPG